MYIKFRSSLIDFGDSVGIGGNMKIVINIIKIFSFCSLVVLGAVNLHLRVIISCIFGLMIIVQSIVLNNSLKWERVINIIVGVSLIILPLISKMHYVKFVFFGATIIYLFIDADKTFRSKKNLN